MYSHMLSAFITALTCWLGAFMEADAAKECRSIQTAEPSKGLMGPFFPCLMWPKHRIYLVNLAFGSGLLKVRLLRNAVSQMSLSKLHQQDFEFPNLAGFFKFNKETFYFNGISTHLLFKQASSDFFFRLSWNKLWWIWTRLQDVLWLKKIFGFGSFWLIKTVCFDHFSTLNATNMKSRGQCCPIQSLSGSIYFARNQSSLAGTPVTIWWKETI